MNPMYDVVILGCGEAGIFAAYELARLHPDLKITALDQGRDIYHRSCPIVAGKVKECIHCPVCDTMCGFGGAGAFSDGKFNFTTQFGGWLTDFMDAREVMELIDYVDSINVAHGATTECFSTSTPEARALERRALAYDLHLLQARCKHLGTENNLRILQNIYEGLKDKLEFRFNTPVTHIAREGEDFRLTLGKGEELSCRWLIAAPGRSGAEWFAEECKGLGHHSKRIILAFTHDERCAVRCRRAGRDDNVDMVLVARRGCVVDQHLIQITAGRGSQPSQDSQHLFLWFCLQRGTPLLIIHL